MKKLKLLLIVLILLVFVNFAYATVIGDLRNSLRHVYNFEQNPVSSNLTDQVENIDSIFVQVNSQVTGKNGSAWRFSSGSSDYVNFSVSLLEGNNYTVSCWANYNSINPGGGLRFPIWSTSNVGGGDNFVSMPTATDDLQFRASTNAEADEDAVPNFSGVTASNWFLTVWRYNNTHISSWINATQVGSELITGTITAGHFAFAKENTNYGDIYIDECYFWNRSLNSTEISQLYKGGNGTFYPFEPITWLPPTPADNITNNTQVLINISCIDSSNVYLWFDNNTDPTTLVINNKPGVANYTTNVAFEDNYRYKAACAGDLSFNSSIRTWTYDTTAPTITVNSNNGVTSNNVTVNRYLDYLFINLTLTDNLGLSEWNISVIHPNGTTYFNYTNNTLGGTTEHVNNNITTTNFPSNDSYTVKIVVSDSANANNFHLNYIKSRLNTTGSRITTDTFTLPPIEENKLLGQCTAIENLTSPVTYQYVWYKDSSLFSQGTLTTNYTSGQEINVNNISSTDTNDGEQWIFSCSGISHNISVDWLNSSIAGINTIGLDNCSTYNTTAANFTFVEEESRNWVRSNIISAVFYYSSNDSTIRNFNFNVNNVSNFSICINPNQTTLNVNYSIQLESTAYPSRTFIGQNLAFSNTTQYINLTLLGLTSGLFVRFKTIDQNENAIVDVLGQASRTISGTSQVVESELTDDSGIATFFLNPDRDYTMSFSKSGYESASFSLRPSSTDIINVVMGDTTSTTPRNAGTGLQYDFLPNLATLVNNTDYNFTFTLSSSIFNVTNCTFYLKNSTGSVFNSSITSFDADSCNISLKWNTGNLTDIIYAEAVYQLNNSIVEIQTRAYTIFYTYTGQFSIKNFFDDLNAFTDAGFNSKTKLLIAFIVILSITALAIRGLGLNNPEGQIILIIALVAVFSKINWLYMDYQGIPDQFPLLKQYIILLLISLAGFGYVLWRHN